MSWALLTRLGEAQILVPCALLAAAWLAWRLRAPKAAKVWLGWLALAIALTGASKVAFMGWGLGIARLDFTGFSGHAMMAAAVYPMLGRIGTAGASSVSQKLAVALGAVLAIFVAVSRLEVHAHSLSEVISGGLLGLAVSGIALKRHPIPPARAKPWLAATMLAGLAVIPWGAPPSFTHHWVTQVALTLSQRDKPYSRADLHRSLLGARRFPSALVA